VQGSSLFKISSCWFYVQTHYDKAQKQYDKAQKHYDKVHKHYDKDKNQLENMFHRNFTLKQAQYATSKFIILPDKFGVWPGSTDSRSLTDQVALLRSLKMVVTKYTPKKAGRTSP